MTKYADVNGARIAYEDEGSGPALLLLHAAIADRTLWDDEARAFSPRFRVVRPDLRGFGLSSMPDAPYDYVADLVGFLDALSIERAHVVGMSMSGSLALRLAIAHPDRVASLTVIGTWHPDVEWPKNLEEIEAAEAAAIERGDLEAAVEVNMRLWVVGVSRQPGALPAPVRKRARALVTGAVARTKERARAQPTGEPPRAADIPKLRVPALVLVGESDAPPLVVAASHLALAIPGAALATIRGAAHLPNLEKPREFQAILGGFLESPDVISRA